MEVVGERAMDIAKELGVSPACISKWRALPMYQQHIEELHRKADVATLRKARIVRTKALEAVSKGLGLMLKKLTDAEIEDAEPDKRLNAIESATLTKASLDAYKTLAAQTGIKEVSGHEVLVAQVDPNAALAQMVGAIRDSKSG